MDAPSHFPTEASRAFLHRLYLALRQVRKSPTAASPAVTRACDRLAHAGRALSAPEEELRVRVVRRSLYLNEERLESDIENFVFYGHVVETLQGAGVSIVRLGGHPDRRVWETFLRLVVRASGPEPDPARTDRLRKALRSRGIDSISVEPPAGGASELPGEAERRTAAKRAYEKSVAISRKLFDGTRMGRSANVKQLKQAVQGIVDGVLHDEASLRGLSALKDYDDYAFTHAVNVCIFCVAIGRRLGLTKSQLYDLGLAALVHDVGMSRIPREILAKGRELTDEERDVMRAHTWLGALSVFELRDYGEIPLQSMIVSYEHHLKADGTGYPQFVRPREPSVFSKIVSVASAFDAATNERAYSKARPADEVLRELWEDESLGYDPVIVKALINLLGIYPVGTCVILDTYELALVHAANSEPSYIHRPVVRLLSDADGHWLEPAPLVDLAEAAADGGFKRSIIKVTNPDRYGIRVSQYFG